jgi:hypothetical protein
MASIATAVLSIMCGDFVYSFCYIWNAAIARNVGVNDALTTFSSTEKSCSD